MDVKLSYLLSNVIGFLFLAVIMGGLIYGIILLVRLLFKVKKLNRPEIVKYYFFMILCIFVMIPSWIFNIGWYRLILTFLAFPIIHSVLFAIVNGKAMLKLFISKKLKIYTLLSYATYIIFYLSFPDGGDVGPMYVFFGLLRSNSVVNIASVLCIISFGAHIIISILQLVEIGNIKRHNISSL